MVLKIHESVRGFIIKMLFRNKQKDDFVNTWAHPKNAVEADHAGTNLKQLLNDS